MTASLSDIKGWLERAKNEGATHLIIAVDTFDFDNYPVYVTEKENVEKEYERIISSSMQGVDEVYNLSMDINKQLKEHRAMHID